MILVGDEPYYGKCGFKRIPPGRVTMPGPVDPERLLVAELRDGAFDGVSGPIRGEWEKWIVIGRDELNAQRNQRNLPS